MGWYKVYDYACFQDKFIIFKSITWFFKYDLWWWISIMLMNYKYVSKYEFHASYEVWWLRALCGDLRLNYMNYASMLWKCNDERTILTLQSCYEDELLLWYVMIMIWHVWHADIPSMLLNIFPISGSRLVWYPEYHQWSWINFLKNQSSLVVWGMGVAAMIMYDIIRFLSLVNLWSWLWYMKLWFLCYVCIPWDLT
jgi:hypothetical protein